VWGWVIPKENMVGNMFHPELKPESYIQIEFTTKDVDTTHGNTSVGVGLKPTPTPQHPVVQRKATTSAAGERPNEVVYHRCSSRIRAIVDDYIHIDYPFPLTNENIELAPEFNLRVMFSTEVEDALSPVRTYAFETKIVEILANDIDEPASGFILVLAPPAEIYEYNRQYWRFESAIWVRYCVIPREEMAGKLKTKKGYAMTANISGGGMLLAAQDELPIGAILELEIDVPTLPETILALGKVVHAQAQSNSGSSGQGVEFILIEESDRNTLVKYIFEQERLSRRCRRDVIK